MSDQPDILNLIAHNTIAVITTMPEKREQWLNDICEIACQAEANDDQQMVELLDAIVKLLGGTSLDSLDPNLEGPYMECWSHIIAGLANASQNELIETVLSFLNTDSLEEKKQIALEKKDILLTEAADEIFSDLLEQYKENSLAAMEIKQSQGLLVRCRDEGIEKVFSSVRVIDSDYVPPWLLERILTAESEDERDKIIQEHPSVGPYLEQVFRESRESSSTTEVTSLDDEDTDTSVTPSNLMKTYVEFLKGRDLTSTQRFALAILSELSCSPWKFDVLWDIWPELGFRIDQSAHLAHELMFAVEDPTIQSFSMPAFDDLTIFADIVGESDEKRVHSREAYRAAYLLVRHMKFRNTIDAPPFPPHAMTQERYQIRVASVGATISAPIRSEACAVLNEAGERYYKRGKNDGAIFCSQTAVLLKGFEQKKLLDHGPVAFGQQSFNMMISAKGAALAYEIAINWWPLVRDLREIIQVKDENDQDTIDALQGFLEAIAHLSEATFGRSSKYSIALMFPSSRNSVSSFWIAICMFLGATTIAFANGHRRFS